jgi:O-antigen biosynthesis protein WbqP
MPKRFFDATVGGLLALLALPVIGVLALVLAADLRTWPFFVQQRVGQFGRLFSCPKLRTLPPDTPPYALKSELDLVPLHRLRRVLRDRHLDELPQLLVVPFGRMSLVGPRPRMPDEHEPVDPVYAETRASLPQGCAGLWQIGPDTDGLPSDSPEYDYFYVRHQRLRLDLWVLWRTALKMVGLARPVSLAEVPGWVRRDPSDQISPVSLDHEDSSREPALPARRSERMVGYERG